MADQPFRVVETRLVEGPPLSTSPIRTTEDAVSLLAEKMRDFDREYCCIINMDADLHPINMHVLSQGGLQDCPVPLESVFRTTILSNASSILLLHNHPSGRLEASEFDLQTTRRLSEAGSIMGLPLIDHIIVAGHSGEYCSIRAQHPDAFFSPLQEPPGLAEPGRGKLEDVMEKLKEGVKQVFSSEKYAEYLKTMSKFHQYSINNQLLIGLQRPDASFVAGYKAWQTKFGRQVKRGEKGINILAPVIVKEKRQELTKDAQGNEVLSEKEVPTPHFRVISVFDVSQTTGPDLPNIAPSELTGKVALYDDLVAILREASPVPIRFDQMAGEAKGYYSYLDKEIVIREGMSEAQNLKTMVHEIAHARLHDREEMERNGERKDIQTKEVEAESVAFVVCSSLGLSTDDYSFPYIAGWSEGKELKVLQSSLATIKNAADAMITEVGEKLDQIDRYEIYQVREDGALSEYAFLSSETITEQGIPITAAQYDRVYVGRYEGESLDDIYARFNTEHPEDYKGHSLSVSDVVVLHLAGADKAYYVEPFGFKEIPDFKRVLEDKHHEKKRDTAERNRERNSEKPLSKVR